MSQSVSVNDAAIGVSVATIVLLTALIVALVVAAEKQRREPPLPYIPLQDDGLAGSGVVAVAGGPGSGSGMATRLKVIPLTWSASGSLYTVGFTVGTDVVEAAFDTGSARFVVATSDCTGCGKSKYNPAASKDAIVLIDPRKADKQRTVVEPLRPDQVGDHAAILCSDTVSYVSQSNNILMYRDTVMFPRRNVSGNSICDGTSIDGVLDGSIDAPPLTVTDFPVGGITTTTGTTALNVFGMSGVLSVTKTDDGKYLLPSCQVSAAESYEAATVQAIALYYTARKQPVVWSQYIGVNAGFMLFGSLALPCNRVQTVKMIRQLTRSTNDVDRTPWRFYVVQVHSMSIDGVALPRASVPKYLIVDTGTTQTLLPGPSSTSVVAQIGRATTSVSITFGSGIDGDSATLTYVLGELTYQSVFGAQPTFAAMPDAVAKLFSADMDVGLFGVTCMRNAYIEYDLTNRRIGFSKM